MLVAGAHLLLNGAAPTLPAWLLLAAAQPLPQLLHPMGPHRCAPRACQGELGPPPALRGWQRALLPWATGWQPQPPSLGNLGTLGLPSW